MLRRTSSGRALPAPRGVSAKYRVRLTMAPILARALQRSGVCWQRIGERLGREAMVAQAGEFRDVRVEHPAERPLKVVFLTMMGAEHHLLCVESALGLALRARGHSVTYVLCDQQLPMCECRKTWNVADWGTTCGKCYAFGQALLPQFGFEVLPVSKLARDVRQEPGRWQSLIESALCKHYHVGVLDDNPEVRDRRARFARSAAISEAVGRSVADMKPDLAIMSHGIYCTWGPAFETLRNAGISLVTYGTAKIRGTEHFDWDVSADKWDIRGEWARVKTQPLTKAQSAKLDSYLASRADHSADAVVYNFGRVESVEQTRQRLRLDPLKPTFVLFTNVLWDAASVDREIAFSNPVDWVIQTLRWFAKRPDKQLVIKVHPSEVIFPTSQRFADVVRQLFPRLPPNVRLIEPQEKVNSWSIVRVADVGLVHTSTVGMELALEGIPCILVGESHYRGCGFTLDVTTADEYFALLEQWDVSRFDQGEARELARRYAYLHFERYQLPFTVLHEPRQGDTRAFKFRNTDDLLADETMRLLVRCIERHEPFFKND